ncbi:unnamed protein product [Angiostrongylus costaricensis]|uniref:Uncharacterized protein n=1 Tax=Angiostrongylus costaricensis TaxID=334426 RepID=A0A0R3Q106_ANGCS|nr:unnamed protein product [Angiostrongylus costaricensis]
MREPVVVTAKTTLRPGCARDSTEIQCLNQQISGEWKLCWNPPASKDGPSKYSIRKHVYVDRGDFTRMPPELELARELTPLTASYSMDLVLQAVLESCSKPSHEG